MSTRRKLIVVIVLASVVSGLLGGPVSGATRGPSPKEEISLEQPSATVPDAGTPGEVGDIWVRPADGMEMVFVPGGEFQMGSTDAEVEQALQTCQKEYGGCPRDMFEPEQPVHAVALDGFWLDRTEVTIEQYRLCVEAGVCYPSEYEDDSDYNGDDQPVSGVYWNDAQTYCQWAGARLPTEAEWEYAARGPEGWVYPWGSEFDGARCNYCDSNCSYDWADESVDDGYEYAAPVGSYPDGASWVGALDMAGNVWEWVADWYGDYPSGKQVNSMGPASGDAKVVRGGSWGFLSVSVPGAFRDWFYPEAADYDLGFRCTRNSKVVATLAARPTQDLNVTPTAEAEEISTSVAATVTAVGRLGEGEILVRPADGMEMVFVPGGEFQMGSNDGDFEEQPVHTVALDGFWLDRTEVTNEQYRQCVAAGMCSTSEYEDDSKYNGDNRPVVGVDRDDAGDYCQWAGARLPTEAEWEYAARGPEGRVYPWGDTFDPKRANTHGQDDGYEYTAPVGSYPGGASWVGALDMAGNVWEWVADWYGEYPSGKQVNPTGPASGDFRVLRGDSWHCASSEARCAYHNARCAYRYGNYAVYRRDHWGFRCARNS